MNCYLLVGGRSRRMGRPKAELPFGGSTFLQRVVAAAAPVFERVVAVQRPRSDFVPSPAADPLETIFEPAHPDSAAIFGLQTALSHAGGRCFVLALDYPLITSEVLAWLKERFEAGSSRALVPVWKGIPQMLCAGYDSALDGEIASRIAAAEYSLQTLVAQAELVPEDELRARFPGEPLMNVNTPAELEEAEKIYGRLFPSR